MSEKKKRKETDAVRFKKNLEALLQVPKDEIENPRPKKKKKPKAKRR